MEAVDPEREARFYNEALNIVKWGEEVGIPFRLLGAIAVNYHCPQHRYLHEKMERIFTDIDVVTYSKHRPQMKKFFTDLGYTPQERLIASPAGQHRHIYWSEEKGWQVDVFFDALHMCHKVDFRGRLELDSPTITLADIILEKMQIVEINLKDIKDTIILLLEHDVGDREEETVNGVYISKVLSDDWGYYYTVTTNLKKVRAFLGEFDALTEENREVVSARIDRLLTMIEEAPKSFKWKARARIGTKAKWYNVVEEVYR
ncbi:MAG TPA: hypothetical protein DCP08_05115 [Chloroflexi bacterium]|nr:hypothetical protein [Chloroflexota bacterium]